MADLKSVANEVHMKYYSQGKFGKEKEEIKEICSITGVSKKEAKEALDQIMHPWGDFESTSERKRREQKEEQREKIKEAKANSKDAWNLFCETFSSKGSKVARCPKCKSASISYGGNRPSLGRAAVGGVLAGAAGATIGGLTGKKGYAVCLNCGKRWKI